MPTTTIALAIGGLAILLFAVGIILSVRGRGNVQQRLEQVVGPSEVDLADTADGRKRATPIADTLNRALEGRKVAVDLSTHQARADLKLTVGEFLALQLIAALGAGVGGYFLFGTIVLALLAAVIGWFAPRWFMSSRQGAR